MDQVKVDATFQEDDLFLRMQYAKIAMKIIENHPTDHGACTIAIDAPWGGGKSTFLHMWINELDLGNTLMYPDPKYISVFRGKNVLPIYYNAWENDFSEKALVPLVYTICAQLDRKHNEGWFLPEDEETIVELITSCSSLLLMLMTYVASRDDTVAQAVGTVSGLTIKGILNLFSRYLKRNDYEPEQDSIGAVYEKQLEIRQHFREALMALTEKCGGVYVFIDELDRCNPSFAINTLEAIKHYFDIPGLVFVFALDMQQLSNVISRRYGDTYDSGGYLSKFFDYHIMLPSPSAEQMIRYCKLDLWIDSENYRHLEEIFRACKVSPREIPRIAKASSSLAVILYQSSAAFAHSTALLFLFLVVSMRYRLQDVYSSYISNEAGWNRYSWGTGQFHWEMLSFFSTYMTRPVRECRQEWLENLKVSATTNTNREFAAKMSAIGYAIIDCVKPHDSDAFGKCLYRFMEHVYI